MDIEFNEDYRVVKISTLNEFAELKTDWNKLYNKDKNSHLYISWDWLNSLFSVASISWFVLAVQETKSGKHIAFFQFSIEEKKFKKIISWYLLQMGAFPLGNFSGLLCEKEVEKPAIDLVANYLSKHVNWDKLFITNTFDARIDFFLSWFTERGYTVSSNSKAVSTRIELPDSWELYLKETIGKQTRKTFVRLLNRLAKNENARITAVDRESIKNDLDIIFELWQNKWGIQPNVEIRKKLLEELYHLGKLKLNVLWVNNNPIAAQCLVLDPVNETIYAHLTGFDPKYPKISPGNMIGLHSIKWAIENGYRYYEFYQGADSYKLAFGAVIRNPTVVKITNKKPKTLLIEKIRNLTKK